MRYVVMAMMVAFVCLDLSPTHAANPDQRESLRGLPGVQVLVEDIRPDAQADGLSQEAIRTGTDKNSSGHYSFNARVELHQAVSLVHRPQHTMLAPTWFPPGKLRRSANKI